MTAKWVGVCPLCKCRHEYEAKTEAEQRNPHPSGLVCKGCAGDILFLEKQPEIVHR